MATKKAPTGVAAPAGAGIETLHGSNSDFILAQNVWNSLVKIWGQEHGLALEVKEKGEVKQVV
ncbi:hypothetical protein SELR_25430 [Selenomonas ruminantium subsp. lactilytica TAM6421]|uniref:Uncharacterized protein n=1 Tax=Selenomonas ruminantium subsp. lactilytica (strain NBRC 103574 / TAM6421) TaxID=927704 RepID=I0GU14_SELRL|nr:hypothetical protein [Selenomonas ruminantium]BAL84251.1 hypothetical protein SELR_25430 [Selenomonas ruminantium subsp. lactilytica TAM6421]